MAINIIYPNIIIQKLDIFAYSDLRIKCHHIYCLGNYCKNQDYLSGG